MSKAQKSISPTRVPRRRSHETRDANVKAIWVLTLLMLIAGVVMHGFLWSMLKGMSRNGGALDEWSANRRSPQPIEVNDFPKLQLSPPADLREFRERENSELNTYAWVDREHGIARVPINVAMELVLKRGLPTRVNTNQIATGASPIELQREKAGQSSGEQAGGNK